MSPSTRATFLAVVVCAVAGLGGGWAGVRLGLLTSNAPPPSLHQLVHRRLQLSYDQKQSMDAIERSYSLRRVGLEAELRAADVRLAAAISADETDTPRVEAAVDQVHAAMGALQKATVAHVLAMRAILTPAQRGPFDQEVTRALAPDPR